MFGKPRWPWITLIALHVIQLASLFPWIVMAGLAFMAFDAPGSEKMWQPWAFVIAIWSYPVWLLIADVISWILLRCKKPVAAVVLCSVVSLPAPALVIWVVVINVLA